MATVDSHDEGLLDLLVQRQRHDGQDDEIVWHIKRANIVGDYAYLLLNTNSLIILALFLSPYVGTLRSGALNARIYLLYYLTLTL